MAEPRSRRRVLALAALWAVVTGAIATASGCYGRTCDPSVRTWGLEPGQGRLLEPDTWESNALEAGWLDFPGQRTWIFEMRDLGGRTPQIVLPYISASDAPAATGSNFALASGNLAEISSVGPGRILVKSGVCADYFLRLVVIAAPVAPEPAPVSPAQPDAGP